MLWQKDHFVISGKNLGPDVKVEGPCAYLLFAPGTLQSVTFVSPQWGQEKTLKTIFVRHNLES